MQGDVAGHEGLTRMGMVGTHGGVGMWGWVDPRDQSKCTSSTGYEIPCKKERFIGYGCTPLPSIIKT